MIENTKLLADCISRSFGRGSIACQIENVTDLIIELRDKGFKASSLLSPGRKDFLVLETCVESFKDHPLLTKQSVSAVAIIFSNEQEIDEPLKELHAYGYRMHPRASFFDQFSLEYDLKFCVLERGEPNVEELSIPDISKATSLWREVCSLINSNDEILIVGDYRSICKRTIKNNCLFKSLSTRKRLHDADLYDLIILNTDDLSYFHLYHSFFSHLKPGGRFVLCGYAKDSKALAEPSWSDVPRTCLPELVYVENRQNALLKESTWQSHEFVDWDISWEGWQAVSFFQTSGNTEVEFPQSEFLSYSYDNIVDHYSDPWLFKSMVSFSTRARNRYILERIIDDAIETREGPDRAAALCVKTYLLLNKDEKWREAKKHLDKLSPYLLTRGESQPIEVRWSISLLYAQGLLAQKLGQTSLARRSFELCGMSDFMRFAPTLATKTIRACKMLAFLSLSEGALGKAESWLSLGVRQSVIASEATALGRSITYPPYLLPEVAYILSLGAQCNAALLAMKRTSNVASIIDAMQCDIVSQIQAEREISDKLRTRLRRR